MARSPVPPPVPTRPVQVNLIGTGRPDHDIPIHLRGPTPPEVRSMKRPHFKVREFASPAAVAIRLPTNPQNHAAADQSRGTEWVAPTASTPTWS